MTVEELIEKFYPAEPRLRQLLFTHSRCVADKALMIAGKMIKNNSNLTLDLQFIEEAAMLHDIGIQNCDAKGIYCYGTLPYICHGVEGSRILAEEGLLRHALVCERHTGSGLTAEEIEDECLPLPCRDMLPLSLEEKIICYADKFYSKNPVSLTSEKNISQIRNSLKKFGEAPLRRFDDMHLLITGEALIDK